MMLSVALLSKKAGFCAKDGNLIQLVSIYAPNYAKPASAFFESYQMLDPGQRLDTIKMWHSAKIMSEIFL